MECHKISVANGTAEMFSGMGIVPWHGLGTVVSGLLTAKEAIQAAHLDWEVKSEPVFFGDGSQLPDYQGLRRADNGAALSVMKKRYEIIQNLECFNFFDRIVGEGKASYETAGALRGGKQVWIMAKYDGELTINKDKHQQWILLVTSHDGSFSLSMQWTTVRVVCNNTFSLAIRQARKAKANAIKLRHTKNWEEGASEAKRTLGLTEDYFANLQTALAGMNDRLLTKEEMAEFTRLLVPTKDEKEIPTRTANIRGEINRLFEKGDGNVGKSRWDAFNAVTDYADHFQTLRGDNSTRLESSLLGSGAEMKQKAYDMLTSEDLMSGLLSKNVTAPSENIVIGNPFADLLSR